MKIKYKYILAVIVIILTTAFVTDFVVRRTIVSDKNIQKEGVIEEIQGSNSDLNNIKKDTSKEDKISNCPFGLCMGQSLDEIKKLTGESNVKEVSKDFYELHTVPKPHPSFSTYIVLIDSEIGVCKVNAISDDIITSVYGTELKSQFEAIQSQLEKTYGKEKKYDFLSAGSIWRESNDWMMGLLKKERFLSSYWTLKESDESNKVIKLRNINTISLQATAISQEKGYISLGYEFNNFQDCAKKIKDKEASSL